MSLAQGDHARHVGDVPAHVGQQEGLGSMLEDGRLKIVQIDAQIGVDVHQHDLRAEVLDGAGNGCEGERVEQHDVTGLDAG